MQSCSFAEIPVAVPLSTVKEGQVLACWDTYYLWKLTKHDAGLSKHGGNEAYSVLFSYLSSIAGLVCLH